MFLCFIKIFIRYKRFVRKLFFCIVWNLYGSGDFGFDFKGYFRKDFLIKRVCFRKNRCGVFKFWSEYEWRGIVRVYCIYY